VGGIIARETAIRRNPLIHTFTTELDRPSTDQHLSMLRFY